MCLKQLTDIWMYLLCTALVSKYLTYSMYQKINEQYVYYVMVYNACVHVVLITVKV